MLTRRQSPLHPPVHGVPEDEDDLGLGVQVMNVAGYSDARLRAPLVAWYQRPVTIVEKIRG